MKPGIEIGLAEKLKMFDLKTTNELIRKYEGEITKLRGGILALDNSLKGNLDNLVATGGNSDRMELKSDYKNPLSEIKNQIKVLEDLLTLLKQNQARLISESNSSSPSIQ